MKGNWVQDWKKSIIILSGGFDPVHKGHLRMFREAAYLGHYVIVGLNSDRWLTRKKGKPFMKFEERKEILESMKYINQVLPFDDDDDTASDLIEKVVKIYEEQSRITINNDGYDIYFANGGDRGKDNVPEVDTCETLNVTMLWGIGGDKIQSSSELTANWEEK